MCGIVGVLEPSRGRPSERTEEVLAAMAGRVRHRGPDADGTWVDPDAGVGLGHRRLSILDLSEHGAQPMRSADGRYVLTYNGEIYDHAELAGDLAAEGVRFRGHSDTEILLEAIARWGLVPTLQRTDGMFALGLWDRRERTLTLARDRMGEKPLYHGRLRTGEVVFGSSLDSIRVHPDFDLGVDRAALTLYLRHKYVPAPLSIFEGVSKLRPGCTLTVRADGTVGEPEPWWSYLDVVGRGVTFDGTPGEAVDELERLLRQSVRRRLVADVGVGAFLSGGIDSSTVVAAAQAESSTPVRTFTIGNEGTDYDESSDARAVAEHLGTDHTELQVSQADALAAVSRMGWIYDEPFGDSSQVPTVLVSELARRDVTVALSGDAGDELFVGYNRYVWVPGIWGPLRRTPLGLRRGVGRLGGRVPPSWWDSAARVLPAGRRPRQAGLKVSKVLGVVDSADEHEVYHRLVSHWQDPAAVVRGGFEPPTDHTDRRSWPRVDGIVEHMAAMDAVTYLPDDILTKVDRATMSVSLEGRIPLLDRDIVELAAGLPLDVKLRDGRSKWIMRELLARWVPPALFERPKSGFGVPIEDWLAGPLRDWAGDHLRGPATSGFLRSGPVLEAWDDLLSGRRNTAYEIWDVLMFSQWCEERSIRP